MTYSVNLIQNLFPTKQYLKTSLSLISLCYMKAIERKRLCRITPRVYRLIRLKIVSCQCPNGTVANTAIVSIKIKMIDDLINITDMLGAQNCYFSHYDFIQRKLHSIIEIRSTIVNKTHSSKEIMIIKSLNALFSGHIMSFFRSL